MKVTEFYTISITGFDIHSFIHLIPTEIYYEQGSVLGVMMMGQYARVHQTSLCGLSASAVKSWLLGWCICYLLLHNKLP